MFHNTHLTRERHQAIMSPPHSPTSSSKPAQDKGFLANLMDGKTPAVGNIEKAYSRAGASNTSTPGHATKLGTQEQVSASGAQGVGSKQFEDAHQDQRVEVSILSFLFCDFLHISEFFP